MERLPNPELSGNFLTRAVQAFVRGDIWTKLTVLIFGAGSFGRKQYIKGILLTLFQIAAIYGLVLLCGTFLPKFGTLGTVQMEYVFNMNTMQNEFNNYDNSFMILLFSIVSIVGIAALILIWIGNLSAAYKLELRAKSGKHVNNFVEDCKAFFNERFHFTLLALPSLGVIVFTVVPLFVMIAVAFTNYDRDHFPPASLFTWVGFNNFKSLFSNSITDNFGYAFGKILVWTLVWAFFATFTTYFGGIIMAKFVNNKKTIAPKLWRTLFIICIAVPQFVTLLLVRYFLADQGIVNTICSQIGLTDFLRSVGLVNSNYIPFLTSPGWAKVMIIVINIWIGVPYQMLIATGVLMNIPADIEESAKIDGASGWQSFWHITMPYMLAVTGPSLVTGFVSNINNFNVIYLLTTDMFRTMDQKLSNAYAKEVDLLVTWLFNLTQSEFDYKMAATLGILIFIICALFTLVGFNFFLRGNKEKEFQ